MDPTEKDELLERIDREFDDSAKGRLAKEIIAHLPEDEPLGDGAPKDDDVA